MAVTTEALALSLEHFQIGVSVTPMQKQQLVNLFGTGF
jgi:hypothetical protein